MNYIFLFSLTLSLGIFLFRTVTVQAATYYVSPTGNDTNPGTQSAPFKSFNKGVSVIVPGDGLFILAGTYPSVVISKSGTAINRIAIMGNNAIISGGTTAMNVTGNYLDISGFEVINAINHGLHITGKHIKLSDFSIHNNVTQNLKSDGFCGAITGGGWGSGLSIKIGSDDIQVSDGLIYNNCGEGMAATRSLNTTITKVTSYDNFSANLYVDNSKDTILDSNFVYCTNNTKFYRNGSPASGLLIGEELYSGWGAQLTRVSMINNIVYGCRGISFYGSDVGGGLKGAKFFHNTIQKIWNNGVAVFINSQPQNSGIEIKNNIAPGSISSAPYITASNNISSVMFQTTPGYDPNTFKLTAGSAGINAGINVDIIKDFNGNTRDVSPDIGAFEYTIGGLTYNNADLEPDGDVDIYDYSRLVSDFGKTGIIGWIRSDIVKNGAVDIFDYSDLVANFGK